MTIEFFERHPSMESIAEYLATREDNGERMSASDYVKLYLPKESAFQDRIMSSIKTWVRLRNLPADTLYWKQGAAVYNRNGLPDIMMLADGKLCGFEVKRPYYGRTTPLQEKTIDQIRRAGGYAWVVSFASEVKAHLIEAGVWRERQLK